MLDELSRKITLIDSLQTIMHFMHIVYMYQYQILTNILHNTYIHFDFYHMYVYIHKILKFDFNKTQCIKY